ncbi:hypothetical protein PYCCODRAFT_1453256 [Trametes coccinea BRFM310]|uniref:Uncharacterized protein n=1 Tax=Trametes coccinea (strain BRFM310) TaxID=1353009 RepID=A0A1Y2IH84_TRAC3|nr:hypothetical protein PYCCODRAFT_1453256 [Trametes coccinea BRFM310]
MPSGRVTYKNRVHEDALGYNSLPHVHVQTIAPLRPTPFPPHPEEPLIEPEHWRHLPSKLARPEMPAVKAENVALAQPGYEGLTPKHVRSGWSHTGYKVLGMYRKLYLDPPKTGIGEGYNLLLTDSGLANCATHIFAVYAYAPPSAVPDPAARRHKCPRWRREVCIYPTHAAIWAAYCARLPPMPKKPTKLKVIADPRPGGRRAYVLRLPMVPVAVPYPPMFFPVMQFVYTYRKSSFVNLLLPCADFVLPPDNFHDPPPEQTIPRYAQALAESFELRTLCRYAKNVHGAYRNMVALGVVEDRMWDALDYAWKTILTAMDLSEKATAARQASDET